MKKEKQKLSAILILFSILLKMKKSAISQMFVDIFSIFQRETIENQDAHIVYNFYENR